jgi:hypothetical protein
VAYLVHVISAVGVAMDEHKVQAMLEWPMPCTVHAVCMFLGLAGYYHLFIQDYSSIATPLTKLLCKGSFKWNAEVEQAFHALQMALTKAPVAQVFYILDPQDEKKTSFFLENNELSDTTRINIVCQVVFLYGYNKDKYR